MGLFTFKHSERDSELERVLQGIPFSGEVRFSYSGRGEEKDKATTSSVYLLPVDAHNNVVYGYFTIDGKLAEVPIGFSRKKNFLSKEQVRLSLDGGIVKQNISDDGILYLPLKLTNLVMIIGQQMENKFVPHEGSPFPVFGVEGTQGSYPLIFVSETEERIICKGLYTEKDGKLISYNHQAMRPADKSIRDFLRELRGVKTVASPKRVLEGIAQVGAGKTAEPAKPLETIANGEINWEEPKSIVAYLDQYVVGQEDAKMIISVAFSNYMTKVRTQNEELQKENILLIGPSGTGKTYMVSLLAKKASLPMVQDKLTGKSTEGYKGQNFSTAFEQMRSMTTGETPYGIIFFDEIDKLARDEWGSGSGFGSRLQDELIGCLEEATFVGDKKDKEEYVLQKVRPEDLITYGLKPELVGRLPSLGVLRPLTIDDKVRILTAAKRSPMTHYTQLLSLKGYQLEIDVSVPSMIASYCPEETGARALNAVCNDLFTEIMFDPQRYADDKKIIKVTPDLARKLINLYA